VHGGTMKLIIVFIISFLNVNAANLDSFIAPAYKVSKSKYFSYSADKLPKDVSVNLLTLDVYNLDFSTIRYCLNLKQGKGIVPSNLYITKTSESDCSKSLFSHSVLKSKNFYNFKIKIKSNQFTIKMDSEKIKIDLYNLQTNEKPKVAMQSAVESKSFSSVDIAIEESRVVIPQKTILDGKICFDVDDECNHEADNCMKCQYGSYTIINSACRTKYSKVCGHNNCGQNGQHACIRGFEITDFKLDYCITDSPAGFCNKGLRVFCHNQTLVCE
jgi:hypothetical protein